MKAAKRNLILHERQSLNREKPNPSGAEKTAQDHQSHRGQYECNVTGNVQVRGEIETKIPPSLIEEYKSAKNATETKDNKRFVKKFVVDILTLIAIVLYTTVAAFQWNASNKQADAAKEANRLLEDSTRARLSTESTLRPIRAGDPVVIDMHIENVGHSLAVFSSNYSYNVWIKMPDGEMPVTPKKPSQVIEPTKTADMTIADGDPVPQNFIDHLPLVKDWASSNGDPGSPTLYLYGRIDYETMGHGHLIEYCLALVRNDPSVIFPKNSSMKNDLVVFTTCPKWNSSE